MTDISNREDILDIRDIIERVEELRGERDDLKQTLADAIENLADHDDTYAQDIAELKKEVDDAQTELAEWLSSSEAAELLQLEEFLDEMKGYGGDHQWEGDWYPVTLIRDSYFEDYAKDLADDIGAIDRNARWPLTHIDWAAAAKELQQDYGQVDFGDITYWFRA